MNAQYFTLFDTPVGRCGLAWGVNGILAASFAHDAEDKTRAQLLRRAPDAKEMFHVPTEIALITDEMIKLFSTGVADFSAAALDLFDLPEFDREVWALTVAILPGHTRTYGALAREMGNVAYSRRVGQALGRNPIPIIIPCHRVVGAGGMLTGFSAPGGTDMKRDLLKIEGAIGPDLFD